MIPVISAALGVTSEIFNNGPAPTHYELDILSFNTPSWAMLDLSYHRAASNEVFIQYTPFYSSLSIMDQCMKLAQSTCDGEEESAQREFALQLYNGPLTQGKKLLRIVADYPKEVLNQLEYVLDCAHANANLIRVDWIECASNRTSH